MISDIPNHRPYSGSNLQMSIGQSIIQLSNILIPQQCYLVSLGKNLMSIHITYDCMNTKQHYSSIKLLLNPVSDIRNNPCSYDYSNTDTQKESNSKHLLAFLKSKISITFQHSQLAMIISILNLCPLRGRQTC